MKTLLVAVQLIVSASLFGCTPLQAETSRDNKNLQEAGISIKKKPGKLTPSASIQYFQSFSQSLWVVADSENVYRTENGGSTWAFSYEVAPEPKRGQRIRGLSFVNERTGFLIVDNELLRSEDGGTSWNIVGGVLSRGEDVFFSSCYFTDSMNGWAVGGIWNHHKEWTRIL